MEFFYDNKNMGRMTEEHDDYMIFELQQHKIYPLSEVKSLGTSLKPLFKRNKKGEWQQMKLWLELTSKGPTLKSSIRTDGAAKTRYFSAPIKPVKSKKLSVVIEEKLLAKWTKKKERDGWVDDKDAPEPLREPQLLHHWDQYKDKMQYPAIISPKLNGVRATYRPDNMRLHSRKRNEFNLPHIERELCMLGIVTDGELWNPDWDFETITGHVKRGGPSKLQYHIFDAPNNDKSYPNRMKRAIEKVNELQLQYVKVVDLAIVSCEEDVDAFFPVLNGLEGTDGAVVTAIELPYVWDSRSYGRLKVKDIISKEYTVKDTVFDDDSEHGHLIKFLFDAGDAGEFLYVPNWTKEQRAQAMANSDSYIDKVFTLEFREYTAKGLPRHIIGCTERNYE